MEHLDDITIADLQDALDAVEGKKPTQRLLAAIAYKNGVSQTELAEWYGVERKTIYNWLKRLDAESLEQAVADGHRSGRRRKISGKQRQELEHTLRDSPADVGYEASWWTPALVRTHIQETYDVEYSLPSCRRLLKEAGLTFKKQPRKASEVDPDDGYDEFTQSGGRWTPR